MSADSPLLPSVMERIPRTFEFATSMSEGNIMTRNCIVPLVLATCILMWPPQAHSFQSVPFPDFDGSGIVDFPDFLLFAGAFGSAAGDDAYEDRFDLDGDGAVGFSDFLILAGLFGRTVPRTVSMKVDFPLRAVSISGHWGTNETVVENWEGSGRDGQLIPPDYMQWLKSLYVNWIGISVALHYDDSMDSSIERNYSENIDISTFPDDVLRQMIREFRTQGLDVYLTLAFQAYEAEKSQRPVYRWLLGTPDAPDWDLDIEILPENWPWHPDHPDHKRFVAEFWETYTQQALHFASIAEEEGVRLYSLGTETDALFRTRSEHDGDTRQNGSNHFGRELNSMVERVRTVYSGMLTYDMHYSVFKYPNAGSDHLWGDLDLDIVGISAWFPLTESLPSTVMSIEDCQGSYERIFRDYLIPLARRNPARPIVFLEYGSSDVVSAPSAPDAFGFQEYVFSDLNGNGLDDGRETQANMYMGLINAMAKNPGVLNGVFFWGNWIASDELWAEWWANRRNGGIRGKPSEEVVRSAYRSFAESSRSD